MSRSAAAPLLGEEGGLVTLNRIRDSFGLSEAELGRLFGVSRQAVDQWRRRGIPATRAADVDRVGELAGLLHRRLLPRRLPQVVRTPATGLRGRTLLQVLESDGPAPIYTYLSRLYSYAGA